MGYIFTTPAGTTLIIAVVGICCLILLFLEGSFLPYKPCRPITYPDGNKTTKDLEISTADSMEEVLRFYQARLGTKGIWDFDYGEWGREELGKDQYLYQCYSVDINGLTTESGCIYLVLDETRTTITTTFFRSEGGPITCPGHKASE